jgi:hypothetical protein
MAVLDAGLAGADARPQALLPHAARTISFRRRRINCRGRKRSPTSRRPSKRGFRPPAPTRCALRWPSWRRRGATSAWRSIASRIRATSPTSCGTRRASP